MATRIKLRRDTAANWLEQNPILAQGETGFETDTRAMKLGDGATRWADLKYAVTGDLKVTDDTIHGDMSVSLSSGLGNRENWIVLTNANNGVVTDPIGAQTDGVAVDSAGNVYTSYWYEGPAGTGLQKISPSGEVLWSLFYNQYEAYGWGLAVDKHDDVILILTEYDSTSNDVVLVKLNGLDGTVVWQKNINSLGDYDEYASCIDIDSHGNIFISGRSNNAGPDNNNAAYVAKFSGSNGSVIWSKQYDVDNFDSSGTGLTVDKDDNIGVVGTSYGPGNFVNMFKIDGTDGSIVWQGKILNVKWQNGNNNGEIAAPMQFADIQSSDVASDAQGNFYITFNWNSPFYPGVTAFVAKFNGSTGKTEWARWLTYDQVNNSSGSLICDELNNVYVSSTLKKYKENYDIDNSNRPTQSIIKFNSTGSVVWQRWLSKEQADTYDGRSTDYNEGGQTIRVNKDYVYIAGDYYETYDYSDTGGFWYVQPYTAQLSRDGSEFDVSGWKFADSSKDITVQFASTITDADNYTYDPADIINFEIAITNADVTAESNSDTQDLVYVNKSNVNRITFEGKELTLPAGGAIDVSREMLGYVSAIGGGNFFIDGHEGQNNEGNIWLNGNDRDEKGNTYSAGGWYSYFYQDVNNQSGWKIIPTVFKTDSEGKLIWSVTNALDQTNTYSADLVDTVYHQPTNTVVVLGNDGELSGHEGFNIAYLDADTGYMKQVITHVRPDAGSNDLYPTSLEIRSNGTPVVTGYITNSKATYADLTVGAAGLTGSTNSGTLVVLKSKFTVDGATEYPQEDGTWYLYPDGAQVYSVNRYGHDEDYPAWTYTGTLGSGATFDVSVSGGVPTAVLANGGGTLYKAGHRIKVLGTALGGTTPENDLYIFIDTVDGSTGAITGITGADFSNAGAGADGTYTGVATTAVAPINLHVWIEYAPEGDTYSIGNIDGGGFYAGVGDTFKILGTALGGATPANDLTMTVTSINATGLNLGGITGFDVSGTPQSLTIKLYGGSLDYTQTGTYNVVHELNNDGFIWTPTWSKVFGSTDNNSSSYDDFHGMTVDSSDNVIVSGYSDYTGITGTYLNGGNRQTGIVVKFSSEGEKLWAKSIDGSEGFSTVWGVATDMDDNIYSVMTSSYNNGYPFITKQDTDGNFVWQRSYNISNSNAFSIDVADNGDVLIVGEVYNDGWFDNNYHGYNWNLLVAKVDKDGNQLFARVLWSRNGLSLNNNDDYSNHLSIKGDRFSLTGYSNDPGDDDYCGIVIDLPLDGSGLGDYAEFHYEEVELGLRNRYYQNGVSPNSIVTDITSVIAVRPYTFVLAPYIEDNAWRNTSIYIDRTVITHPIYQPEGGEIKGIAKITFEDGSVQTTSMQGLPQVRRSQSSGNYGGYDYWLRPEDNGKHILQESDYTVIIPSPGRVNLPIGFAITIINEGNSSGVWAEDYNENIYLSGGNGDYSYSWEIPAWSMATLVKTKDGRWMIAGTGVADTWNY